MTDQRSAAIDRYTEFEVERYVDSWAIFGKGSDYPIAQGEKADMEIIVALLNARTIRPYVECPHCGTLTHEAYPTCVKCGQSIGSGLYVD